MSKKDAGNASEILLKQGCNSQYSHLGELRSTQPCIPPGSLNRVPALAGVKAGKSPLPG